MWQRYIVAGMCVWCYTGNQKTTIFCSSCSRKCFPSDARDPVPEWSQLSRTSYSTLQTGSTEIRKWTLKHHYYGIGCLNQTKRFLKKQSLTMNTTRSPNLRRWGAILFKVLLNFRSEKPRKIAFLFTSSLTPLSLPQTGNLFLTLPSRSRFQKR